MEQHNLCSFDEQLKYDLTNSYHLASHFSWDDLIYTHFSIRSTENKNTYYINPFGLLFSEITPETLLQVDLSGNILGNNPYDYNPAGENIHGAIYKARPDVNAIVHIHTLNGMALSSLKDGLLPICQQSCHFYGRMGYHTYNGIAVDVEERESFINDLGDNSAMILHNHGLLTVGDSIQQAFCDMHTLEKAATVQMMALASGRELILPETTICEKVIQQTKASSAIKNCQTEWNAMMRLLKQKKQEQIFFNYTMRLNNASLDDKNKIHLYDGFSDFINEKRNDY